MSYLQQGKDLKSLGDLIAVLGGATGGTQNPGPNQLLLEHLQAARRGLLGSMHGEYGLSLEQAKESVASIPDKQFRASTRATLQGLIDSATTRAV